MKLRLFPKIVFTAFVAYQGSSAAEFDWPQWQGPERNAISKETSLLKEWPKEGPALAWKTTALGGGDSAPSVAKGFIYGMSSRGSDEVVWALSEKDGKEAWVAKLGPSVSQPFQQSKEGPAGTPTVDGDRLYVEGMAGEVFCLKASNGEIVWQRSLQKDFGGKVPAWSYRESLLVDGEKVICTPGGADATLVALDKMTGKTLWKSALPSGIALPAGAAPAAPTAPAAGNPSPGNPGSPTPGNRGGGGGFSIANNIGSAMFAQADADKDKKLTRTELTALADTWFEKLDPEKTGKVTATQFSERFYDAVPRPENGAGGGGGGGGAPGSRRPSRSTGPAFVTAADTDKDGSVTREELKTTFGKWFDTWDAAKAGSVEEAKFKTGLDAALPTPQFGGGRGFGGGGGGGGGGFGGAGNSGAAYSSAIAIEFEGQRQYVQLTSKALMGVSAADGKFLWRYDRVANGMGICCSTPLYINGQIFAASAYGAGGALVKLIKDDKGGVKAEEVWFTRDMENHHGGVVLVGDSLYGANGGNGGGYPVCLDLKTGEVQWNERDSDKRRIKKGSVVVADGKIYYRSEEGAIVLIDPSRKEYVEKGRFEQPDRTRVPAWAHPVVANGKLYIRDQDTLYCYDVKAK